MSEILKNYLTRNNLTCGEFGQMFANKKSPQYVWQIVNGVKVIGIQVALEIAEVTNGEITPSDLRPDLKEIFS